MHGCGACDGSAAVAGVHAASTCGCCLLLQPAVNCTCLLSAFCSAFSYMARELRQLAGKSASSTRLHPVEALNYDVVLEISRENR